MRYSIYLIILLTTLTFRVESQTVARHWNETLLHSIRNDFARPTVHARNLFHVSAAMYDAWALMDDVASTFLIGKIKNGYFADFEGFEPNQGTSIVDNQRRAISFAAYRLLKHRFRFSPGGQELLQYIDNQMAALGYNINFEGTDYSTGDAAALGNYIAEQYIQYGLQDGAREEFDYANAFYAPINPSFNPADPGNPSIQDLNRWQPLALDEFVDQSGNPVNEEIPFLSPEWGEVWPFAMNDDQLTILNRDDQDWRVYEDPGAPPFIEETKVAGENPYKWGFELVSIWGSHLDPSDGVMWDISPAGIGNMSALPETISDYPAMYDEFDGGDGSQGRAINPATGAAYPPNMVPRGDYARVLAEFWADGPESETPPGHWFVILNKVMDHPLFETRFEGQGEALSMLAYELKAYFTLSGAMHDAAIAAWSVKGYYDYIRPVSAIRAMAELGQASDENLPRYHEDGLVLKPGYIELVTAGDPLAGSNDEHVNKIKLYTWRGPDFIQNPSTDMAGVGWILAENWWPYQRPTFVTPPFAGYVSGHSTFSRAAAEVLTLLTGDEYFPGGVGEFEAPANQFLVFEEGPSVDVTLQWATYRDASDQTSLSRIWGGIHPPADDIPGRKMGIAIGTRAFEFAKDHFEGNVVTSTTASEIIAEIKLGPNPIRSGSTLMIDAGSLIIDRFDLVDLNGQEIHKNSNLNEHALQIETSGMKQGIYLLHLKGDTWQATKKLLILD